MNEAVFSFINTIRVKTMMENFARSQKVPPKNGVNDPNRRSSLDEKRLNSSNLTSWISRPHSVSAINPLNIRPMSNITQNKRSIFLFYIYIKARPWMSSTRKSYSDRCRWKSWRQNSSRSTARDSVTYRATSGSSATRHRRHNRQRQPRRSPRQIRSCLSWRSDSTRNRRRYLSRKILHVYQSEENRLRKSLSIFFSTRT